MGISNAFYVDSFEPFTASHIKRPVEDAVIRRLDYGIPYWFEDVVMHNRTYNLEFTESDWLLYLLMMRVRGRVFFGSSRKDIADERENITLCGVYLNMDWQTAFDAHAELTTKILRRESQGFPPCPELPEDVNYKYRKLVKTFQIKAIGGT